jgi:hypothetical protein
MRHCTKEKSWRALRKLCRTVQSFIAPAIFHLELSGGGMLIFGAFVRPAVIKCSAVTQKQGDQGPMLWFFKYFRRKIQQKIGVFDSKQS